MTGRINYSPEADKQLNELDNWITQAASAEIARRFVLAILNHIDGILVFPLAGRARDDVRPGMRTTTFKRDTLVAYEVDESSVSSWSTSSASSMVARIGRPRSVRTRTIRRRANDPFVRGNCVAGEPAATVRDQRPTRRLRRSAPQCQQRP